MADRNSLLGRSRPNERLSRDEIAALDKVTSTPRAEAASTPAKPAHPKQLKVPAKALNFHWITLCPSCGRKAAGQGIPKSGQCLARCGAAEPRFTWLRRE